MSNTNNIADKKANLLSQIAKAVNDRRMQGKAKVCFWHDNGYSKDQYQVEVGSFDNIPYLYTLTDGDHTILHLDCMDMDLVQATYNAVCA